LIGASDVSPLPLLLPLEPPCVDAIVVAVTARVVLVAVVVGVATVVAVTTRVVLVAVVVDVVEVLDVVDTITPLGGAFQPRIVVPAHCPVSRLLSRPNSLWSIDKFQRALIEIQFEMYVHQYPRNDGSQFDGSLSLFDRLLDDDTASSVRGSLVSFANAVRCASFQPKAPESHASFSATT